MPKNQPHQKNRSGFKINQRGKYPCPECDESFRLLTSLDLHLQKEHQKTIYHSKRYDSPYKKIDSIKYIKNGKTYIKRYA